MANTARLKGPRWEADLVKGFRSKGLDAERLRMSGRFDQGDLVVKDLGHIYVVEAKDRAAISLPTFVDEAKAEAGHYAAARNLDPERVTPVAIVKRRGKNWLDAYVVTDVRTFFDL